MNNKYFFFIACVIAYAIAKIQHFAKYQTNYSLNIFFSQYFLIASPTRNTQNANIHPAAYAKKTRGKHAKRLSHPFMSFLQQAGSIKQRDAKWHAYF